ncbi:hypothetical protein MMYC01_207289 [Madurella mycetomatis]|uniref:Uncharacterized protein n=1 Tax=Madurella mycetomatis TaxID=100816 RepID=A0A175VZC9_9PEZI|nr:hypothetical protein MMYC01_207289 [Madurella mycetomatis]
MAVPDSPTRSTGKETSSHPGLGESGMDCSPHQAGIAAESDTRFASTPRSPMIIGQTRQPVPVHPSTQVAGNPEQDPDRGYGFGNEKATACPNVVNTGDGAPEQGVLDVASPDGQKSDSVSETSTWSVNAQHGSLSPSQALQASQNPSASHNQRVDAALRSGDTATMEQRTEMIINPYIIQHQKDHSHLLDGPQCAGTVDEERMAEVEQAFAPLVPLGLSPVELDGSHSQYRMVFEETKNELNIWGSDSEGADDI